MKSFSIRFGIMSDPLASQFKSQGFDLKNPKHWERRAKAISELRVLGILTDSEARKAEKRFMARIKSDVRLGALE